MDAPLTIAAFSLGTTQLVKKLGVQGNWLILVCLLCGAVASYMTMYQPEIWANMSHILIALSTTGVVSFVDDRLSRMGAESGN